MPKSSTPAVADVKSTLEAKPLKFIIETGGSRYVCQLHPDRATYERDRSTVSSSSDSIKSDSTSTSKESGSSVPRQWQRKLSKP